MVCNVMAWTKLLGDRMATAWHGEAEWEKKNVQNQSSVLC